MIRALKHIEVDCDAAGCVVVGVARNGERLPLTSRLTPYVARDHALGKGEFFNCDVVHIESAASDTRPAGARSRERAASRPDAAVRIRTTRWERR